MLKKIILIDSKWDIMSPALQYTLKASRDTDTEITGIFLVADTSKETIEKAEKILKFIKQNFVSAGVNFTSYIVEPHPGVLKSKIDGLIPASLVLIGDVKFTDEMIKSGVSIEALREKLNCPVITSEALASIYNEGKKTIKGINWRKFITYAAGSVIMYGIFFPSIELLNKKIFMTETIFGAIAIMVAVAVHAWIWGNTTQILPKIFKLEK